MIQQFSNCFGHVALHDSAVQQLLRPCCTPYRNEKCDVKSKFAKFQLKNNRSFNTAVISENWFKVDHIFGANFIPGQKKNWFSSFVLSYIFLVFYRIFVFLIIGISQGHTDYLQYFLQYFSLTLLSYTIFVFLITGISGEFSCEMLKI